MFNNGPAQGLSGGGDDLPLDPREAYFQGRMRRHETGDDIIENPALLWSANSPSRRRTGLREHLLSQQTDGPANFTDILVVVNEADYRRTLMQVAEPWTDTAARVLTQEFEAFSRQEAFQLPFASRGIRFRVIRDGGVEMGNHSMGLIKGEYVTGLLPNLYTGPIRTSRPILAFHLALPGAWDGYQEVGRMYSDQVQFTLGNHWLDSAAHPLLREPALYLVQQYLDGSLDPRINPDLRDRYSVTSQQTDGVDVQTISSREDGAVIAYLVVALMDSYVSDAPADEDVEALQSGPHPVEPAAERPAPASMNLGYSSQRTPEPARPAPLPLKAADTDVPELELDPATRPPPGERPKAAGRSISNLGQKTIVPDAGQEQIFTLKERGALLQKVHFRKFMQGYDVYISQAGTVSTHAREPAATLQVREDKVTLVVHRPEVTVNGAKVTLDQPMPLYDRTLLMVGPHSLEYNDLTRVRSEGWPYLGEILRPAGSTHMVFGGRYRIGRDRRCKVQLPDEPHNENIVWLDGASTGTTIRARSGEIPKSRFYTDSIMVASEHAEVDLRDGKAAVNAIARHCFTYVRRDDQILPLYPTKQGGDGRVEFEDGDELLVGNCLFKVDFGSVGAAPSTAPAPAPPKRLTADSLARAVEFDSDFGELSEAYETHEGPPPRQATARERLGKLVAGPFDELPTSTEPATVPPDDDRDDEPTEPVDARDIALDLALSARGHRPFLDDEVDLPPAHGLGERGPAPSPPKIPRGFDSLLGELPQIRTPGPKRGEPAPSPEPASPLPPPQRSVGFDVGGIDQLAPPEPPELGPTFAERPDFPTEDPFDEDEDEIIAIVNEERWQMELARPARLLLLGWAISGEAVVGNYRECAVVVPESRSEPHQLFHAHEYFKVKVRSNRGKAQLLDPEEARLRVDGDEKRTTLEIDKVEFEIIRRDADGDEDFSIILRIDPDRELPDPRARLLSIDHSDRIAQALFTVGFPQGAKRKVRLGPVRCYGTYADGRLTLSDYLRSYRQPDGSFLPFFIRKSDGVFRTAPEDGREVVIEPGDQVLVERSLYEFSAR
ncbi:MAG: hypothetical protein H6740_08085 [Alphaproteobacteria bacterium]|nr:hypothetical protein [Alphaproteobacteria bacterium]